MYRDSIDRFDHTIQRLKDNLENYKSNPKIKPNMNYINRQLEIIDELVDHREVQVKYFNYLNKSLTESQLISLYYKSIPDEVKNIIHESWKNLEALKDYNESKNTELQEFRKIIAHWVENNTSNDIDEVLENIEQSPFYETQFTRKILIELIDEKFS